VSAQAASLTPITGVVLAVSQPPPARWQVRLGRRRWQRSAGGWFEVDQGGVRAWIEVSSLVEILGDVVEEDGLLEELAERAGLIGELGPPGTPARLSRIAVTVGEEIAVAGELAGPSVVRGVIVACGPGAARRLADTLARRAAAPTRPPGRRRR
jgi:hypothetical protein